MVDHEQYGYVRKAKSAATLSARMVVPGSMDGTVRTDGHWIISGG